MKKTLVTIALVWSMAVCSSAAGRECGFESIPSESYHKSSKQTGLNPSARKLAEQLRDRFGRAGAPLPSVDANLSLAARAEVSCLMDAAPGERRAIRRRNLRRRLRVFGVSDYHLRASFAVGVNASEVSGKLLDWCAGLAGDGWTHLGVAIGILEKESVGTVILTRRPFRLDPAPRRLEKPGKLAIAGKAVLGNMRPEIFITAPNGRVSVIKPALAPSGVFSEIVRLEKQGTYDIELVTAGGKGPQVAALMAVNVGSGGERPRLPRFSVAAGADAAALIREILGWTGRFRAQYGLEPLKGHSGLDGLEAAALKALPVGEPLSHLDEQGGNPEARLVEAGYSVLSWGENLVRNRDAGRLVFELAESPAHRRNLLSSDFTHMGVGLVRDGASGQWTLGLLFAGFGAE